jgi:hypothetical protein
MNPTHRSRVRHRCVVDRVQAGEERDQPVSFDDLDEFSEASLRATDLLLADPAPLGGRCDPRRTRGGSASHSRKLEVPQSACSRDRPDEGREVAVGRNEPVRRWEAGIADTRGASR